MCACSPSQHGIQQDSKTPDVTALIVALALQHLQAHSHAGEGVRVCVCVPASADTGTNDLEGDTPMAEQAH